jgi:hypothetical protein
LVINDDPYFWTKKFIEMIIVLVEIRKIFSWRYCLWMAQGKGTVRGLSLLLVKVISGEMTRFSRIDVVLSRGVIKPLLD